MPLSENPLVYREPLPPEQHTDGPGDALAEEPANLVGDVTEVLQGIVEQGESEIKSFQIHCVYLRHCYHYKKILCK